MNSRAGNSFGTHQQRGFWLRCFLDRATWPLLFLLLSGPASAQLDIPGPVHLTHVEGQVVNSAGQPVANLEVTLNRDNKVAFRTSTSQSGPGDSSAGSARLTALTAITATTAGQRGSGGRFGRLGSGLSRSGTWMLFIGFSIRSLLQSLARPPL